MKNLNTRWWAILFVLILCVWVYILRNSEAEKLADELAKSLKPTQAGIQTLVLEMEELNGLAVEQHGELVDLLKAMMPPIQAATTQYEEVVVAHSNEDLERTFTDQQIQEMASGAEDDPHLSAIVKAIDEAIVGQMMIDEVHNGIEPDPESFSFAIDKPEK